jgi:hypothetical protein
MKKLICLFLVLWLPISAGSAWAMSTQMQVNAALDAPIETMMDMPCHDMAADNTDVDQGNTENIKHNCAACGACFSISIAGMPSLAVMTSLALTTRTAPVINNPLTSQIYPPALRPPIAS